jgi:flagellar assembly protein FliH
MSFSEAATQPPPEHAAGAFAFEQLDSRLALAGGGAREAERLRRQAWAQGEAEGRQAGLAQALEAARPALEALGNALVDLDGLRAEVVDKLERDAVELALALADQIVGGALELAPERVVDIVRGALRRLNDRQQVTVLVNPDDIDLVGACVDGLRAELGGIEHLAVQADRRIIRGGAVVRTQEGEIDAQVATQLARARAIVAAELSGA